MEERISELDHKDKLILMNERIINSECKLISRGKSLISSFVREAS